MNGFIIRKIRNTHGESIAEVLIALLISALALLMLATMISSTMKMVTKSKEKMESYYAKAAKLEVQADEDKESGTSTLSIKTKTSEGGSTTTQVEVSPDIYLFKNPEFGENRTVYAYRIPSATQTPDPVP